jgi:hypothetical protein
MEGQTVMLDEFAGIGVAGERELMAAAASRLASATLW